MKRRSLFNSLRVLSAVEAVWYDEWIATLCNGNSNYGH